MSTNHELNSGITEDSVTHGGTTIVDSNTIIELPPQTTQPSTSLPVTPLSFALTNDINIYNFNWSSTDASGAVLLQTYPFHDWLATTAVSEIIERFYGVTAGLKLTIMITPPAGCAGALVAFVKPHPFYQQARNTNYTGFNNLDDSSLPDIQKVLQYDTVAILDASKPATLVLDLPIAMTAEEYCQTTPTGSGYQYQLYVRVLSPLVSLLTGASVTSTVRMFISGYDVNLFGASNESGSSETRISSVAMQVSKVLHQGKKIPIVGGIFEAGAKVSQIASDIASFFGFSRPPLNNYIYSLALGNRNNVDAPEVAEPLCMYSKAGGSLQQEDPLLFDSFCQRETIIAFLDSASLYTTALKVPIALQTSVFSGMRLTPLFYLSLPFNMMRYDTTFVVRVFSNEYANGILAVYYVPWCNTSTTEDPLLHSNVKKVEISLRGSSCTEIDIGWISEARFLPVTRTNFTGANLMPQNGMIIIKAVTPTTTPTPQGELSLLLI